MTASLTVSLITIAQQCIFTSLNAKFHNSLAGNVLGQLVRMSLIGPWSFMVCKIIYTLDEVEEDGSSKRYYW